MRVVLFSILFIPLLPGWYFHGIFMVVDLISVELKRENGDHGNGGIFFRRQAGRQAGINHQIGFWRYWCGFLNH
ncbi:hypothetical protein V8F06_000971 [Rhypophila decipiens]